MDPSRSRTVAQHEILRALRRIFPEPLIELRTLAGNELADAKALHEWTAKWHLEPLADLVPAIVQYWAERPAAAERLSILTIRPEFPAPEFSGRLDPFNPNRPLLAHPDFESLEEFKRRAEAHYEARSKELGIVPVHRKRRLRLQAERWVRHHVQGWSMSQIADAEMTAEKSPDVSTMTKSIQQMDELLRARPVSPVVK